MSVFHNLRPKIKWYKDVTSCFTVPDSFIAKMPAVSRQQRITMFGISAFVVVGFWIGILITNITNGSNKYTYYVTLSNSAVAPTAVYLLYQAAVNSRYSLLIDVVFALFSGTSSCFYHFCDDDYDRLPYCEVYECWSCQDSTAPECIFNTTVPECYAPAINRCCATFASAEAYEKLQHLDFGSAYFLVCMTILMCANIQPIFVKACVYLAVFKECWEAMTLEHRFGKGAGTVFLVACSCLVVVIFRLIFIILKIREAYPNDGTKGAFRKVLKAAPWRLFALASTLAFFGVYSRFGMEDTSTGLRKDYAVPHAWWHVGVMSATVFLSKFAVDFNKNCKEVWDVNTAQAAGVQMVDVDKIEKAGVV